MTVSNKVKVYAYRPRGHKIYHIGGGSISHLDISIPSLAVVKTVVDLYVIKRDQLPCDNVPRSVTMSVHEIKVDGGRVRNSGRSFT